MIGTPIQGTLWQAEYLYRPEAPAIGVDKDDPVLAAALDRVRQMFGSQLAGHVLPPPKDDPSGMRTGTVFVLTADPSGADLLAVVERACREAGTRGSGFALVRVQRICDVVRGMALLVGGPS